MKKLLAIILCAAAVLSLAACAQKNETPEETEEPMAYMANPFVDYKTIEEAEKAAGFELEAPESVAGYSDKMIQVMSGKMIQIIFLNGDDRLFIRKQAGSEDISGSYTEYSQTVSADVGGRDVTYRGDNNLISNATWVSDGYSYAVMADTPIKEADMAAIISQVK